MLSLHKTKRTFLPVLVVSTALIPMAVYFINIFNDVSQTFADEGYTYYVNFNANTDTTVGNMPEQMSYGPTSETSHSFVLPDNVPTRSDRYDFAGWCVKPNQQGQGDCSRIVQPGDSVLVWHNDMQTIDQETLYAIWEPHTVTARTISSSEYPFFCC